MKLRELLKFSHNIIAQTKAPHALIGAFGMAAHGYRMTNEEYLDFVDEFLELFPNDAEKREKIIINSDTAKL